MSIGALATVIVDACRRHALLVVALFLLAAALGGFYSAQHLSIDTDLNKVISPTVPWRQQERALNTEFPQNSDLLAIVLDGATPDQAEDAATALAARLRSQTDLFKTVRVPEGGRFFQQNGLLFLPTDDVQKFADQIIAAQPMLGTLAADPSLGGVFASLDLLTQGALHGDVDAAMLDIPFTAVAEATENALAGRNAPLSWQTLLSGRAPDPRELRRIILVQPVLDYDALEPGERATNAIRAAAGALGLTPDRGLRLRITGDVALSDDQLAALTQGAGFSMGLSFALLCVWLFVALRSPRLVAAILVTLVVGLIACATFAAAAVGALNPISVAFAVLFVGIAVDFGIQFSVRYRDERFRAGELGEALRRTATGIGGPLAVAALATAVGFFAFVPTDYVGVSDLGLIAGVGMLIALALNLTLLPALLTLLRPRGEQRAVGFAWAAPLDHLLLRRRRPVAMVAVLLALGSAAALPGLRFDFNPLNLLPPSSAAVQTLFDLMSDPTTTPYTIEILSDSPASAAALATQLDALPEVAQTISVQSFVPENQPEKLAILADAATLLAPTLSPAATRPPLSDEALLKRIAGLAAEAKTLGDRGDAAARRLAQALDGVVTRGAAALPLLKENLAAGIGARLEDLRLALAAMPVTVDNLPPEIKSDWVAADGKARIEIFPKGDARDNAVLRRFVAAVRQVTPTPTGSAVTIQESADTVIRAFVIAGLIALAAIAALLLAVLRRINDAALVLGPLLLAGLLTLATSVLLGWSLNYANVIALPLLLGIGVSFDIYFVMRWRAGTGELLQSSTARAVLFSALTTGTAFGSLALSNYPGTAEMGKLLTIALLYTLLCTFIVLPALLGPIKRS